MPGGIQLKVKIDDSRLRQFLLRELAKTHDLKPLLSAIGATLVTAAKRRIGETHKDPEGRPWQALAPATIKAREERPAARSKRGIAAMALSGKTGAEPLFDTGMLLASLTYKATETGVAIGSNRKFKGGESSALAIHQLGGKAGRGHSVTIPARPFLGIGKDERSAIDSLVNKFFGNA